MTDRDILSRAVLETPDDDTLRLVYADALEEGDEPDRAAFVRAQVELARTPPWEPFAVQARWRDPNLVTGKRFAADLPRVDGYHVEWAAAPFRRGFGWALHARNVAQWDDHISPLFDREPVGKLQLWHGALDDWRRVAASDRLRHFRELVFNLNPIEPLLALRDQPAACGITDLHFERASGAGMPEVLEGLAPSALGRAVRGLHFRVGYESLNELVDALNTGEPLARLSFAVMGVTAEHLRRLFDGSIASELEELHLRDEPLGSDGLNALADGLPPALRDLELAGVGLRSHGLEMLSRCDRLASLRRLRLSRNPLTPRAVRVLSLSRPLAGLRALDLSECRIGDKGVRHVTQAKFWRNLVELDLRKNPISAAGARHLLDAPPPPDLTALVLDADAASADVRSALVKKYGAAIVFATNDAR